MESSDKFVTLVSMEMTGRREISSPVSHLPRFYEVKFALRHQGHESDTDADAIRELRAEETGTKRIPHRLSFAKSGEETPTHRADREVFGRGPTEVCRASLRSMTSLVKVQSCRCQIRLSSVMKTMFLSLQDGIDWRRRGWVFRSSRFEQKQ